MKWVLRILCIFCTAAGCFQWYVTSHVLPNTFLGTQNISGQTRAQALTTITKLLDTPVTLHINNQSYFFTYQSLGIQIDPNSTLQAVFEPNRAFFPATAIRFVNAFTFSRTVVPYVSFTHDFFSFVTLPNLGTAQTRNEYRFDKTSFQQQILSSMTSGNTTIIPTLIVQTEQHETSVTSLPKTKHIQPISSNVLGAAIDGPNTDGTKAAKYIEIDLSQQRMYLFQKNEMIATYQISSGLDFPTPTGEFKIYDKAPVAFSGRYNVWMPYWMAFYFHPTLKASFGIHELPFWYESGKKRQRPSDYIGSPHTGGCVALDVGKAKEVYAFAPVGTPVYIFQ